MVEVTRLLRLAEANDGPPDEAAIAALYDEVRRLARGLMRGERANHTLAPTALANEAWLRLFGCAPTFANGPQFFAAAATTLRRVLVEHGRRRAQLKRGGRFARCEVELDAVVAPAAAAADARLLELDAALERLASFDLAKAKLVELRFFAGLSVEETARVLGVSERTAAREWRVARAYLLATLGGGDDLDA
jgi:RNA polymerase sigma factor (TIGR02999 family)